MRAICAVLLSGGGRRCYGKLAFVGAVGDLYLVAVGA